MKKKLIAFDLDGVIINSIKNMQISWKKTCQKNNINISFEKYKKHIGLPFNKILDNLNIKKKYSLADDYKKYSVKYSNLIYCYRNIKKVICNLKKKHQIAIITSKDRKRAKFILKKKNIKYDILVTPDDVTNGKPNKEAFDQVISKTLIKKKNIYYVGDMGVDRKFALNSGVNFIYASWGYGNLKEKNIKKINKPLQLLKIFL